ADALRRLGGAVRRLSDRPRQPCQRRYPADAHRAAHARRHRHLHLDPVLPLRRRPALLRLFAGVRVGGAPRAFAVRLEPADLAGEALHPDRRAAPAPAGHRQADRRHSDRERPSGAAHGRHHRRSGRRSREGHAVSIELLSLLFFAALLFFLFRGLPLAFVLGGVSIIFLYFTWGAGAFYIVASQIWGTMNSFTLIAIPLFVFMAMVLERTGVAQALYAMMHLWW